MARADVGRWRAILIEDFPLDSFRVVLMQQRGDHTEVLSGWDEHGFPTMEAVEPGVRIDHLGLLLPDDAVRAIAEAVKPGPSQGELRRLEDALDLERSRVEKAINAFVSRPVQ